MREGDVLLESYGSDDVFDVRSRPLRVAGECDVVRHVSERDQEHSERYRLRFVREGDVLVESVWCDDVHVLSSWYLRQHVECDCMHRMRRGSLRDVSSIVDVRRVFAGQLYIF